MFNKSILHLDTLTLGELLLTTLKMLIRQSRIVINNPIRPATTCSKLNRNQVAYKCLGLESGGVEGSYKL